MPGVKGPSNYSQEPSRHPCLSINAKEPFNAEPPRSALISSYVTPVDFFYKRNHGPIPVVDDIESYRVSICGLLENAKELSMADIRKLPKYEVTATLQCAGNRRTAMSKTKTVKGVGWGVSAIGTGGKGVMQKHSQGVNSSKVSIIDLVGEVDASLNERTASSLEEVPQWRMEELMEEQFAVIEGKSFEFEWWRKSSRKKRSRSKRAKTLCFPAGKDNEGWADACDEVLKFLNLQWSAESSTGNESLMKEKPWSSFKFREKNIIFRLWSPEIGSISQNRFKLKEVCSLFCGFLFTRKPGKLMFVVAQRSLVGFDGEREVDILSWPKMVSVDSVVVENEVGQGAADRVWGASFGCGGDTHPVVTCQEHMDHVQAEFMARETTWGGAKLSDVLELVGIPKLTSSTPSGGKHVEFVSVDKCKEENGGPYKASIPLNQATNPDADVLLAYEMNGETLNRDHGYPLRGIVPGVIGARSVKWLDSINVIAEECQGFFMQKDYKMFPPTVNWDNINWSTRRPQMDFPVQSVICSFEDVDVVKHGKVTIRGYAASGGGRGIERVDVSVDGGKTWIEAFRYQKADVPYIADDNSSDKWAWVLFEAEAEIPQNAEIVVKAVDTAANVQPENVETIWNLRGILNTSWHRVQVRVGHSNM
ncbi:hypothetical protein IFM89_017133 [Coptis chinensis]|uniref:Sulfite oxidase n=1 Tax=Coptis chinensis TaxID=261450 RepID=A0A835HKT5_9MAGN|nr:hypothetical protein IFM89_017133 [Coptis chinensis]